MTADRRACGFAGWPIWRASAVLAAVLIPGHLRAEAGSQPPIPHQATESSLRGNPLWAVPLAALADTRARPIFSPSRRPPSPPVVASQPPPKPKPPPPKEPDRLKLTLLGTVIAASESIGVFLDETSKEVIRIRTGASHNGWTLSSLQRRAASFEKNRQETTLVVPAPGSEQPASGVGVRLGGINIPGNRDGAKPAEDRARPVALTLPAPVPATPAAHKIRQEIRRDILSIGAQN
jgi:general secretion pathway protein N